MSVSIEKYASGVMHVLCSDGTNTFLLYIAPDGDVTYRWNFEDKVLPMQPHTAAQLGRLLCDAAAKPDSVQPESEVVEPVAIQQLRQLMTVTHHTKVIDVDICERLVSARLMTCGVGGYDSLTEAGIEVCWALGLLDGEEGEDA